MYYAFVSFFMTLSSLDALIDFIAASYFENDANVTSRGKCFYGALQFMVMLLYIPFLAIGYRMYLKRVTVEWDTRLNEYLEYEINLVMDGKSEPLESSYAEFILRASKESIELVNMIRGEYFLFSTLAVLVVFHNLLQGIFTCICGTGTAQ